MDNTKMYEWKVGNNYFIPIKRYRQHVYCLVYADDRSIMYKCSLIYGNRISLVRPMPPEICAEYSPEIIAYGECICCHNKFVSRYDDELFCSKECFDKYCHSLSHDMKRSFYKFYNGENGEVDSISLNDVYVRDKGVCKLCGKKTLPPGTEMCGESPSVDHILPLSKGGTNTWDNVQLAHVKCNTEKADKVDGIKDDSKENVLRPIVFEHLYRDGLDMSLDGTMFLYKILEYGKEHPYIFDYRSFLDIIKEVYKFYFVAYCSDKAAKYLENECRDALLKAGIDAEPVEYLFMCINKIRKSSHIPSYIHLGLRHSENMSKRIRAKQKYIKNNKNYITPKRGYDIK